MSRIPTKSNSSAPLPKMCVEELTEKAIASALRQSKLLFEPSARPSNWLENPIPPTAPTAKQGPTGKGSPNK
jgi:hypothetical protein